MITNQHALVYQNLSNSFWKIIWLLMNLSKKKGSDIIIHEVGNE
jgi:G:T/U-mismatch repair DNA glycosylase